MGGDEVPKKVVVDGKEVFVMSEIRSVHPISFETYEQAEAAEKRWKIAFDEIFEDED